MYILKENKIVPIDAINIAITGKLEDKRITQIEQIVSEAYNTTVHELNGFVSDTDAKLMCCFLLHHLLNYSVFSLAKKYKIYKFYLKNRIQEHYERCLLDSVFMGRVMGLKDAFLNGKVLVNT